MIIYKIDQANGYYAGTMEVPDDPDDIYGIPYGTTKKAPPDSLYAIWNGSGWDETTIPPPEPKFPEPLIKIDAFYDRFGSVKYDIIFSNDPEVQSYIQETRTLPYINLNDPRLSEGVDRLLELGFVFNKDAVLDTNVKSEESYII